jgi:hypothetical protein
LSNQQYDWITEVDWKSVAPNEWATPIPDLLLALIRNTDNGDKEVTRYRLVSLIAHQGGLYETTAVTIPILISLLKDKEIRDKSILLNILSGIPFHSEARPELAHRIYKMMKANLALFEHYLNHDNMIYRQFSSQILSNFVHDADVVSKWLMARLDKEKKFKIIYHLLFQLGMLVKTSSSMTRDAKDAVLDYMLGFRHESEHITNCATVYDYVNICLDETPTPILQLLIKGIGQLSGQNSIHRDLVARISSTIWEFSEPLRLQILLEMLNNAQTPLICGSVATPLLMIYFEKIDNKSCRTELTALQKQVLEALLISESFWGSNSRALLAQKQLETAKVRLAEQIRNAQLIE